jgi:hypothetical protein
MSSWEEEDPSGLHRAPPHREGGQSATSSWRARRDSNPRPSDPKSGSRSGLLPTPIRARPSPSDDPVTIDFRVCMTLAPGTV